jgi:hypothetical protein
VFNAFEELFAPGRKHTRDEENRLELTREDVGDADPGRGPIDLASGKVVVRRPDAASGAPSGGEPAGGTPGEAPGDEPAGDVAQDPGQA